MYILLHFSSISILSYFSSHTKEVTIELSFKIRICTHVYYKGAN